MSKLTELSSEYLHRLQGYNLYTPKNIYELKSSALNNTLSTIISTVGGNSIDFSNTIAGRILLPNTPIQKIANIEMAKTLAYRVAGNLRTEVLPTLSVKGNKINFNKANHWSITKENTKNFSTLVELLVGYTSSNFDNPIPFVTKTFTSEDSANFILKNSGDGQVEVYQSNIDRNTFKPTKENQYSPDWIGEEKIILGTDVNSILFNTNKIINNYKLDNQTDLVIKKNGFGSLNLIPRGGGTFTDDKQDKFLRVFSKNKPYASTGDLMKFNHGNAGVNSVLQTVYPNIAPKNGTDVKNLMFSIENLAYKGKPLDLKPNEKGVKGGRVMWFPPYGLTINESISTDITNVQFIGRSEPIYTYNGRERTLNITFLLVVDYPKELDNYEWRNNGNNEYDKFFREDNNGRPVKTYSVAEEAERDLQRMKQTPQPKTIPVNSRPSPFVNEKPLTCHFDNNTWVLNNTLTQDTTNSLGNTEQADFFTRIDKYIEFLNTDEGKNFKVVIGGYTSSLAGSEYNLILSFLRAKAVYNYIFNKLNDINSLKLEDYDFTNPKDGIVPKSGQYKNQKFEIISYGDKQAVNNNSNENTINKDVIDRKVVVTLDYNPNLDTTLVVPVEDKEILDRRLEQERTEDVKLNQSKIKGSKDNDIFERYPNTTKINNTISESTNLLISQYKEGNKYFSPVFHSQTPQDFNTRLTFLQQCTLQGTGIGDAPNSIFGKPPVSILRIGDFFHTQIIINSVNISYDPLVWDVNPEGIGMQPMYCEITMECKMLGGQALDAPHIKLQNALDYNFYANTEVYEDKARSASIDAAKAKNKKTGTIETPKPDLIKVITQENRDKDKKISVEKMGVVSTTSKTIKYTEKLNETIEVLSYWVEDLKNIYNIDGTSNFIIKGIIEVNTFNNIYTTYSPEEKENNKKLHEALNMYYQKIRSLEIKYDSYMDEFSTILAANKDGNKTFVTGVETVAFNTMFTKIEDFFNNILIDFANKKNLVNSELGKLNKFLSTVKPVPYN